MLSSRQASAEVMLDSFRPGVLDRLGLGPQALAEANPRLVHVSLTAFGDDGPYATLPTHDLNVQALGGILSLSTDDAGEPAMPALQAADLATGWDGVAPCPFDFDGDTFRKPGGIEWRGEYENLARHYDKLMERPAFAETAPPAA